MTAPICAAPCPGGNRHSGITQTLTSSTVSSKAPQLRCLRFQIHQRQPVCRHMTSVPAPLAAFELSSISAFNRGERRAERVFTAALSPPFTPRNCVAVRGSIGRGEEEEEEEGGETRAIASPGPTLQ
ncbi:hypothetical protein VZT92_024318 [Zoarces viviparus]|uniref:Uncharacterized protein n=1 Tax=Zoarces viviparus TaxID=48416 RepID=A0AAW1E3V8_ZOAVI